MIIEKSRQDTRSIRQPRKWKELWTMEKIDEDVKEAEAMKTGVQ
mgnify:CR=1 FL=1